jgi:hypothetical protein
MPFDCIEFPAAGSLLGSDGLPPLGRILSPTEVLGAFESLGKHANCGSGAPFFGKAFRLVGLSCGRPGGRPSEAADVTDPRASL